MKVTNVLNLVVLATMISEFIAVEDLEHTLPIFEICQTFRNLKNEYVCFF